MNDLLRETWSKAKEPGAVMFLRTDKGNIVTFGEDAEVVGREIEKEVIGGRIEIEEVMKLHVVRELIGKGLRVLVLLYVS